MRGKRMPIHRLRIVAWTHWIGRLDTGNPQLSGRDVISPTDDNHWAKRLLSHLSHALNDRPATGVKIEIGASGD